MGLFDGIFGKKNLQRAFEHVYRLGLKGMNYGRASDYRHNGEAWLADAIRHMIPSSTAVLFDVGANQGVFANHLIKAWQGMNYQLHAFEPSVKTFERLRSQVPDLPYVHLVNKGLGEEPGTMDLYFDKEGSGLASVYPRDLSHYQIDFTAKETIQLSTLDADCAAEKIEQIDFLKLDVEGHELAVLKGGKRMIGEGRIRLIQFEFGGCNIDSRTYFRDYFNFFKDSYTLYRILSDGLQELPAYNERLEVFQSANYLAIRTDSSL